MDVPPADHRVHLYMRVDSERARMVGTARSVEDVPRLLRGIAESWQRRLAESDLDDEATLLLTDD